MIFLLLSISATADYPDFSDLVDEAAPAVVNVSVIKTISTQNRMSPFNRRQNPFDDFFNFPFPFEDEPRREQEREVQGPSPAAGGCARAPLFGAGGRYGEISGAQRTASWRSDPCAR